MKHERPLPDWLAPAEAGLTAYATLLATDGVTKGLIGPREVDRIWTRHLLNCAVVVDPGAGLVPEGAFVADVGSGAGLPGLVWAIARPDLTVACVEPLLRRTSFLEDAISRLGLADRVTVLRARAEDRPLEAAVVTARAVAPLVKLLPWTVPLLAPGGRLVALKGSSATREIEEATAIAEAAGMAPLTVVECGSGVVDPPTIVVTGVRQNAARA